MLEESEKSKDSTLFLISSTSSFVKTGNTVGSIEKGPRRVLVNLDERNLFDQVNHRFHGVEQIFDSFGGQDEKVEFLL